MQEAWRTYLELALGVTEASKKKAEKTVKRLAGKGGATADQIRDLAGELVATSAANREALAKLVRFEVDRALGVVGLATAEEVAALNAKVADLEGQLRTARSEPAAASVAAASSPTSVASAPAKRSTSGRKAATRKTAEPAKKARPATKAAPAKRTEPAKKAEPVKKVVAKKTGAKKAPARKSTS